MPLPDVRVVMHTGDTLHLPGDLRGRWTVVGWVYTHCPDVCPLIASRFMALQDSLVRRGYTREQVLLMLLSFDPERDTLPRLQEYARHFRGGRLLFMGRLDPLDLLTLSRALAFSYKRLMREPMPSHAHHTGYAFAHDVKAYLVSPEGRVVGLYEGSLEEPLPVDAALDDLVQRLTSSGTQAQGG